MKHQRYLLIVMLLVISQLSFAQKPQLKVFAELKNGAVYLAWLPESWPDQMSGVIVKRKTTTSNWQVITAGEVIPASYQNKDLSNIEPSLNEQRRLNLKMDTLIKAGKARTITAEQYHTDILSKPSAASSIAFLFAMDYDLMLLNGFGLIDRRQATDTNLSYGFFAVIDGEVTTEPISTFELKAGDPGLINLEMIPKFEVIGNNQQLRLHWNFSLETFRTSEIKGFNLYKSSNGTSREKINRNIIWITSKQDPADLNYLVDFPGSEVTYTAIPVSYFNTPGVGVELTFDPKFYSIKVPAPVLQSYIADESVVFDWQLEHGYDSLISSIYLQRKVSGTQYELIKKLQPDVRTYTYTLSNEGFEAQFRLVVRTRQDKELWSNERFIKYDPKTFVPAPSQLNARIISMDEQNFIQLEWQYPAGDASEVIFRIFTDGPRGELIYDSGISGEISSPLLIPVKSSLAKIEKFAVQAMRPDRTKSDLSNMVEIITPTTSLPPISIEKATPVSEGIEVSWRFSQQLLDLKGFKIFVDGNPKPSQELVQSSERKVILKNLELGKHKVSVVALTTYGYESEPPTPYIFSVK